MAMIHRFSHVNPPHLQPIRSTGKTAVRNADGIRALGTVLEECQWHRGTIVKASAAMMSISVEKESKVPVMLYSGKALVRLLKVSARPQVAKGGLGSGKGNQLGEQSHMSGVNGEECQ